MRGECIAISTAWKKNTKLLKQQTEVRLWDLESWLTSKTLIRLLREIVRLRSILKNIDIGRVEKALQRLHWIYYDKGNKANTLLARKLRALTHAIALQSLRNANGILHSNPDRIVKFFCNYFSDFYNNLTRIYLLKKAFVTVFEHILRIVKWLHCQQQPYSLLIPQLLKSSCWKPWNFYQIVKPLGLMASHLSIIRYSLPPYSLT